MRAGCSYAQFSVPDLRDAMQAAYGPEETMPVLSEAESNESNYTVKGISWSLFWQRITGIKSRRWTGSRCKLLTWGGFVPLLHFLHIVICMQVDFMHEGIEAHLAGRQLECSHPSNLRARNPILAPNRTGRAHNSLKAGGGQAWQCTHRHHGSWAAQLWAGPHSEWRRSSSPELPPAKSHHKPKHSNQMLPPHDQHYKAICSKTPKRYYHQAHLRSSSSIRVD